MTGKELEERQTTLTEKLKAKAVNLTQGSLSEICIILVDTSSSMNEGVDIDHTKSKIEAVRLALPNLRATGVKVLYGLVGFGNDAFIYQQLTMQFGLILSQGEMLSPSGMTNIAAAIKDGMKMMGGKFAEKKRMILLSDGCDNVNNLGVNQLLSECQESGIVIDTIAFGTSADKHRLRYIAERTGGVFCDAADEQQLKETYSKLNYNVRYLTYGK